MLSFLVLLLRGLVFARVLWLPGRRVVVRGCSLSSCRAVGRVGPSSALVRPGRALLLARAMARCSAVSASRVPACPMGMHTRRTSPRSRWSSSRSGWYLSVFSSNFALRLRSYPKPTSMSRREQLALSNEDGSGLGTLGTPRA